MKKHTKNIIAFFICILIISNEAFSSEIIYSGNTKNVLDGNYTFDYGDGFNITYEESGKVYKEYDAPKKEVYVEDGSVEEAIRPKLKDKDFVRKESDDTLISLSQYIKDYINPPKKDYLYITHTNSITRVEDSYEFLLEYDSKQKENRWVLNYVDYDRPRQAKSGFYIVDDKTYYFDADGFMYVGKIIDSRGNEYEFDENGAMK